MAVNKRQHRGGILWSCTKSVCYFIGTDNSSDLIDLSISTIHFYNVKPHRLKKTHRTLKIMFLKSNNIKADVMLGQQIKKNKYIAVAV